MPPAKSTQHANRGLGRWVGACIAVLILLIIVFGSVRHSPPESSQQPIYPPERREAPLTVEQSVSLTVPDNVRTETHSFYVQAGRSYLLSFTVSTVKPRGTPGTAMYLGISLGCTGGGDREVRSVSGTQNILDDEPVRLSNQFLMTATQSGQRSCNVQVSSPNESAAAVGATVDVDVKWEQTPVGEDAQALAAGDRLPAVVQAGERRAAFRGTIDIANARNKELWLISTLHLTTCTIVNGSREGGEPMCIESEIDSEGSSVDVDLRANVLDENGGRCDSLEVFEDSLHIDRKTHHQLLSLSRKEHLPAELCGETLEFVLAVDNGGPAPLVVHGGSSSFIFVLEDS